MKALTTKNTIPQPPFEKFVEWMGIQTFDDPEIKKYMEACRDWYTAFINGNKPRWLVILGTSGAGKTHCATRLFKWANSKLPTGRTVKHGEAFYHYDTAYNPHPVYWAKFIMRLRGGDGYQKLDDMAKWPVLFLDDIGAERDPSGFAAETLNTLLGCRIDKWTILTSNKSFEELQSLDVRITSRLIRDQNICVVIKTKDFATR